MFSTEGHPILLLGLGGRTGASFAVLGGHIAALLEGRVPVFQDMLDAEVLALQAGLRARAVRERARLGLLRPGDRGDPAPIGRQDVDPNPVHAKASAAEPRRPSEACRALRRRSARPPPLIGPRADAGAFLLVLRRWVGVASAG